MLALLMVVSALFPGAAQARKPAAAPAALVVKGVWVGEETAGRDVRHPTVTFSGNGGTLAYEDASGGAGTLTLRLQAVSVEAAQVRFAVPGGGKLRHYFGRWDGRRISGTIATDASGQPQIGTFVLRRPIYDDEPVTADRAASASSSPAAGPPSPPKAASSSAPGAGAPTEIDSAREAGRERLQQRLKRLSEQAGQLLQKVSEWQQGCQSGGTPLYDFPAIDCDAMVVEAGRLAVTVGGGLDQAEDEARRSWVEPGVVRDLRAQYGLDHSKWDELSSKVRALEADWRQRHR